MKNSLFLSICLFEFFHFTYYFYRKNFFHKKGLVVQLPKEIKNLLYLLMLCINSHYFCDKLLKCTLHLPVFHVKYRLD